MSGIGEASLVLGLVSSTIAICEAAHNIYDAASDVNGLPKKMRFVAEQIPLAYNALRLARHNLGAKHVTEEAFESIKPVLEQCEKNASNIKEIFQKTIPAKEASRAERLKKAVGINMKSNKVKEYMEEIFKSLQLLAQNQVFQDTETLAEINRAIEQLKDMTDAEEQTQFQHSGMGPLNANTAGGVQNVYSNSGSGTQYAAHNQYFGRDQAERTDAQCLQHLRPTDPRDDKTRIEQTKGGLLSDSYRWIFDNADYRRWRDGQEGSLLWIKGNPGKGKTMMLCGIIEELRKPQTRTYLLSFFFCQATDSRINSATAVLRGLIYLLVQEQPSLISHVREKYDQAGRDLFEDVNAWVALSEIFTNILQDPALKDTILIVDALDECVTDKFRFLDLVIRQASGYPRVKWVLSSRDWLEMEEWLKTAERVRRLYLELNAESVSLAVRHFIAYKVSRLAQQKGYSDMTKAEVAGHLSCNAKDTFLWVALVCQDLEECEEWEVSEALNLLPPGLEELYGQMIHRVRSSKSSNLLQEVLALATVVLRPVALEELASLDKTLDQMVKRLGSLEKIIRLCGSFLTLQDRTIYFVHQSAKDFLLKTLPNVTLSHRLADLHHSIFLKSLEIMSRTLHRDMYRLEVPGFPIDQVRQPQTDPLVAVRYSCIYWVEHSIEWLQNDYAKEGAVFDKDGPLATFFRQKFLHWLEALSLLGGISEGLRSVIRLEQATKDKVDPYLFEILRDARRFLQSYKWVIENYPLQVYASALVFSPTRSLIRESFKREKPGWMRKMPTVELNWSACLQTLEGHTGAVYSVAFSHDSRYLASASNDRTIKIWDTVDGTCLQTLEGYSYSINLVAFEGHRHSINLVAFSHDSKHLASASWDETIKIWDMTDGRCVQTLEGHSDSVNSVAFSHDSKYLASVSNDKTVKIWDITDETCLQTLEGHTGWVNSIAFSHDSKYLASASYDKTVKIWDITDETCLQTLEGHSDSVYSVAFSHDSKHLASTSSDMTVKIWDIVNGKYLQTLEGHTDSVYSIAFSHDSQHLASASWDETIKIWDTTDGRCVQTLEGHSNSVYSVAFSHDSKHLASASSDKTVKIWDIVNGTCLQTLESHSYSVNSVAFSHDSKYLASASDDITVKIWDVIDGRYLQTLEGHTDSVNSTAFSHDNKYLASASDDNTVKIWDTTDGKCLQTLEGHSDSVYSVAFSHDSKHLASASNDSTIKIWDIINETYLQTLEGHSYSVNSVAFSYDSKYLASASWDKTVKIWDTTDGRCVQTLEGHSDSVRSVAFLHDSKHLASASWDETVKIWDVTDGRCVQTLDVGRSLSSISFDTSGSFLYTEIGTFFITTKSAPIPRQIVATANGSHRHGLSLSTDQKWIMRDSENLLWLPPDYRPSVSSVSASAIAIGCPSGGVFAFSILGDREQALKSDWKY